MTGFWKTYMLLGSEALIAMGVIFAVLGIVPGGYGAVDWINQFLGGVAIPDAEAARTVRFLYALMGGVTAGWGLLIFLVVKREALGANTMRIIGTSAALWFVLDAGGSLVTGFYLNAAFSTAFLVALVVVPTIGTARGGAHAPARG